jgi:hypothetical protein
MLGFDEFVSLWNEETKNIKIKKEFKHMLFLVVYPDKLKWDFGIEKQTQTTTFMMSGGATGTGTGHDIRFCYRSEVHNLLLNTNHTHAMIVSVGMVFDMVSSGGDERVTSITDFYYFVESGLFCKTHIIAKPDRQVFFHHQHMNLNLTMWKDIGAPDMSKSYDVVERSPNNYHDDYTPTWIELKGMPTVTNFTKNERSRKAFSYYRDYQTAFWKDLDNVDKKDYYFSKFMTRIRKQFYIENNESLKKLPKEKFDLIITTTAGYRAAVLVDKLEFDGEVVLYDYCQENINIKQMIIEMNMSLEEINLYSKTVNHFMISPDFLSRQRLKGMGSFEEVRKLEETMYNNYDIEYWLMDLILPDYDKLLEKIKGKTVFFDATNIFSYHLSHAYYTLDELVSSYKKLHGVLKLSNKTYFRGTKPTKQRVSSW